MKQNAIYIMPPYSLFNRMNDINFKELKDEDYIFLKSTLYLNLLENVEVKIDKTDIFKIFDFSDKELLPDEFIDKTRRPKFRDINNLKFLFKGLSDKEFISYKNNLIIFSDVINIRATDVEQYINILSNDENSIVLAKSSDGRIRVFGFHNYSDDLFKHLTESLFMLDNFLSYNKSCDYFVTTCGDVFSVMNINDFKKLYTNLSLKKSFEYCSQQMHERFTHLFIEYKDLLK